ncbi:MAG: tRNA pseudouridine(38-40) synthase TruA, partial [Candidatus Omnitrophota bacterium]
MRNIKLTIEYDGTRYAGWQDQGKKHKTIQQALEMALGKILHERVMVIGSGRTDAGVHALAQVANFKTDSGIKLEKLRGGLNAVLPQDIVITGIEEVGLGFHSRFCAKAKVYRYTICNRRSRPVLSRGKVYFIARPLDLKLMQREARVLLGRHNFKSFQASGKIERNPVKRIKKIKLANDKDLLYIDIEANGFLYYMVRNIVGT